MYQALIDFQSRAKLLALTLIFLAAATSQVFSADISGKTSSVEISSSTSQSITVDFDLSEVRSNELISGYISQDEYIQGGEGTTYEQGRPVLPAVIRTVIVPSDAGLELVVQSDDPRRVRAINPPILCNDEILEMRIDGEISPLITVYPPVIAEMSEPFVIRGVRMVHVTTYPVQYDPQENEYLHRDNIQTEIRFTDDEAVNPAMYPVRRNRSKQFLKFIRDYAINGDMVGRDDPNQDQEPEYVGHYAIAIHENCLQYAAPFIEWRRKSGWKVDVIRLTSNQARTANTVKGEIQDLYDSYLDNGFDPFDQLMLIGDHASYEGVNPGQGWVLASPQGIPLWGNHAHYDWDYACLEGNDSEADVSVARWIAGSQGTMQLFMHRTMSYETTPYMEETEWFTRGAVYAQRWAGNYHPSLATNVRWGKSVLESIGFDDVRVYENMNQQDSNGALVGPFIRDQFNQGVNVMLGRAENYYFRQGFNGVNAGDIYPIDLDIAGHHEWSCWHMLRNVPPNQPRGPVAATTGWGGPQTTPMSTIWLGMVNGFVLKDMTFGWSRLQGVLAPNNYIPNWDGVYRNAKTDVVYYGDPGLQYWKGIPQIVEAEFPNTISPTDRFIEVYVLDPEADEDVSGAQVTLYVPGDMPDFDNANYATYEDMYMITRESDEDGIARFIIPEDVQFDEGDMFVTVTGREILPFFGEIEIDVPNAGAELAGWTFTELEGNEDDAINPGESFEINVAVQNLDDDAALENLTVSLENLSPYVEIAEDNEIVFENVEGGGVAESDGGIVITIAPDCPDSETRPITQPAMRMVFTYGEEESETAIQLDVEAPNFIVNRVIGGIVIEDELEEMDIEIKNIGRQRSEDVTARLVSQGMGVSVAESNGVYEGLAPNRAGRLAGDDFTVNGSSLVVPGSKTDVILILSTEEGFVDTAHFELQISEARENAPQGPDGFGYICFDDTDDDWDMAPVYDWVEISRVDDDWDHRGTEMDFSGNSSNNIGETIVLDLPFRTQFYGIEYDQISVATNGFISMGDQEYVTNYQNWPMDRCQGGGVGMLAPLWDDLSKSNNGDVYYFYDEENARFIVEWYRFRHRQGGNSDLNFQVILYDNEVWITETGDQNILFQYKTVSNVTGRAGWNNAVPYASVGISSPHGDTGINYTFNNQFPVTSARLADRRAILFSTAPRYRSGVLYGVVTNHETGEPIPNAIVTTQHGFSVLSDEEGNWRINDALAEVEFYLTCLKQGYNDSMYVEVMLPEDDTLEINFDLLHPEFTPSVEELEAELPVPEQINLPFELTNTGNGPLTWRAEERLRGDANAQPWELRRQYPIGQTLGDSRLQGVVYANDQFYIAGSNDRNPQIYVLDREGELIEQFDQFGPGNGYGHKDLAFDGEWIWGSGTGEIYAFTPEGELMTEIDGPFNPNNNFAWDLDREQLWVSSTTSNIMALDREGNVISELARLGMRIYGLSYWPDDPDGYSLYIYHKISDVADQIVTKMNPETNDTMFVAILEPEGGGTPAAAYSSNQFDVYSWVFISISNSGPNDRIDIWQIDARRDWFELDPTTGVLNPDDTQEFVLNLNSTGLPEDIRFEAELRFYHNAVGGEFNLLIALDVLGGIRTVDFDLVEGWNLISGNVVPENLDVRELTSPLVEGDLLIIMKNGLGQFYLPEHNFNNIDQWEVSDGYQVNVREATHWEISGAPIESDTPIALREGWNMKAYFPRHPIEAPVAFAGITEILEIAKDGIGNFYLPEFGFSNMGNLIEGLGYQLKMTQAAELVYQDGEQVAALSSDLTAPKHFSTVSPTDANMSILLTDGIGMSGNEVAAFTSAGRLVGSGRVNADGQCGLAAWGDDLTTNVSEGALHGEALMFKVWNDVEESDITITPVSGEMVWTDGNIFVGKMSQGSSAPATFGIHDYYPNPANGPVRLSFGLENDAHLSLKVFDLSGRLITTLANGNFKTGNYQMTWNTDAVASGLYLVKLAVPGRDKTVKVAVMK
ncbi:MAG: T9SS type A sorting domain-containing protein [Calditrichaeota bacterium]|nr:T9SS type A sorting domain-containing protein [Calditrichota bacterium]